MESLRMKRASLYDELLKLNTEYSGEKFTPTVARQFSALCDNLDELNAKIQFENIRDRMENVDENLIPTYFDGHNEFRTSAAKRTLAEAFGLLARG